MEAAEKVLQASCRYGFYAKKILFNYPVLLVACVHHSPSCIMLEVCKKALELAYTGLSDVEPAARMRNSRNCEAIFRVENSGKTTTF